MQGTKNLTKGPINRQLFNLAMPIMATSFIQMAYANEKSIRIIGDIPIYVAFDSADTWANPVLFQFDEDNQPKAVAGCPPDAFSDRKSVV